MNSEQWELELTAAQAWLGAVVSEFSRAEQALGRLAQAVDLKTDRGNLSNLRHLRDKLSRCPGPCASLDKRISEWANYRELRHLLAHATLRVVTDHKGRVLTLTRICPLSAEDQTPDRAWSTEERDSIRHIARRLGQSIEDKVDHILSDADRMKELRAA